MLETVKAAPPDPILGLTEEYKKDENPDKINLGVGVYQDDNGRTPILDCVGKAEEKIRETASSKSYLPITGAPDYGIRVRELLFGDGHPLISSGRVCTAHTPGGTGALRVGADFIRNNTGTGDLWVSQPTWANHKGVFTAGGMTIHEYAYYDATTHALNDEAFLNALTKVPAGHVVLLHVCCHNPTGVDPSTDHWKTLAEIAGRQGWIPFLDFAYQGFGVGLDEDRVAVEIMVEACEELFIASSFSKNFGLYQERTGALTMVARSDEDAQKAASQLKKTIRTNYSNPPAHGGLIVQTVLNDSALREQWLLELSAMRDRIQGMREALVEGLTTRGVEQDFSFIRDQKGMFSFSGLSDDQVEYLRFNKSIYIVAGGRINVAGITRQNIEPLCDAIAEALKN